MFLGRSLPIATTQFNRALGSMCPFWVSSKQQHTSNWVLFLFVQRDVLAFVGGQCCHCCSFSLLLSALPKTTLRTKFKQYVYSILRSQRHAASKYFNSLGFCGVEMYDFIPWATWWGISPHSQIGLLFQCSEKRMQGWNGEHLGVGVNPVPLQSKLAIVTGVPAFAVMFTKEMEIHVAQAKVLLQKESSGNRY